MPPESRRRAPSRTLLILAAAALIALALSPLLVAGGVGRLVADLWITTISAVAGLLGGLFGG